MQLASDIQISNRIRLPEYIRTAWRMRSLCWQLAMRSIQVRYKQKILGIVWVVVEPAMTLLIFVVVFGILLGQSDNTHGIPYPLFTFAALMAWQLFSSTISIVSGSILSNADLLTKVYFPRIILPISGSIATLVDFAIVAVLYILMVLIYGLSPTWQMLFAIPLLMISYSIGFGAGLIIASFNIRYRDFGHILPVILRLGIYATPIGWSADIVPDTVRKFTAINPITGLTEALRWSFFGTPFSANALLVSIGVALVLLPLGLWVLLTQEKNFADFI